MVRRNVRLPGARHVRQMVHTGDETFTQQSLATETDVNVIMRRFGATGGSPVMNPGGMYGDFTGITDFESALGRVDAARAAFMQLAPEVRERFENNPALLLDYAQGMSPEELAKDLGFVIPKVASVPEPAAPVAPAEPVG